MIRRLLDKDTQVLVKAGYINGHLEWTSKSRSATDVLILEEQDLVNAY